MEQPIKNENPKRSTGIPKGVYRFKTHEEANAWMDKMLAWNETPKTEQLPASSDERRFKN